MFNDKTIAIHFHRERELQLKPSLTLHNLYIPFDTKMKILGLSLDKRLRWEEHVKYLKQKTIKRLNMLKSLSQLEWGVDQNMLLKLFQSLIRSKIDCGMHLYRTVSEYIYN